jgi:hypothetical protein
VQGDGVSCGPIACLKVMEIYGFIPEGSIKTIRGYRHVVMDYFNECVSRYDNVLKVAVHTKNIKGENNQIVGMMMLTLRLLQLIPLVSCQ